jgi:hypothetical protein
MVFTYNNLSYSEKREYIIQLLASFAWRWDTFSQLGSTISHDISYPEDKLDYIEERFVHYLSKTQSDNVQAYEKSIRTHKVVEEAATEEELEDILAKL